jgi:hypothetical protein
MGVSSSYLLQLILQLANGVIFAVLNFLNGLADGSNCSSINMCSLQDLVEL